MAHENIDLPRVGGRIHPHFGVFAPIRREYIGLVEHDAFAGCVRFIQQLRSMTSAQAPVLLAAVLTTMWHRTRDRLPISSHAHWRCALRECSATRAARERVEIVRADIIPRRSRGARDHQPAMAAGAPEFASMENGIYNPAAKCCVEFLQKLQEHLVGGRGSVVDPVLAWRSISVCGLAPLTRRVRAAAGLRVVGPKRCTAPTSASR